MLWTSLLSAGPLPSLNAALIEVSRTLYVATCNGHVSPSLAFHLASARCASLPTGSPWIHFASRASQSLHSPPLALVTTLPVLGRYLLFSLTCMLQATDHDPLLLCASLYALTPYLIAYHVTAS